jgi:transcriptional regulator of acetoin/glycerol metabolism
MRSGRGETLSLVDDPDSDGDQEHEPHLFLVVQASRPRDPSARYRLALLDEVVLGRGSARRAERGASARHLRVVVADPRMSSEHAALVRTGEGWRIHDRGSKNGTLVNGVATAEALLRDGDLIEVGQTFFIFRESLPTRDDAPAWIDAGAVLAAPGMGTLLPALGHRFAELAALAASRASILILGPSGSGKELLAQALHECSGRGGPFVPVNCAALPEGLVESELFGYVRGAFSGADRDRDGLIAASAGGTLFLDEIGDLPRPAQAKLLRVLQEQEVRPVGATAAKRVDLRVVAATHRDLERAVDEGAFREDLLARLGGVFELPALAERREDLGLIIASLLTRSDDIRAAAATFTSEAMRAILRARWPRNVRELDKCLERAVALSGDRTIEIAHLPEELRPGAGDRRGVRQTQPPVTESAELTPGPLGPEDETRKQRLVELLAQHGGNVAAVARDLETVRSQVQRWMKRYGISGRPR